jgi:diguanylate cyclase (GGDEF)-like protein/PAS domain S-box-containing protein
MILDQQTVLFMSFIFAMIAYFIVIALYFLYRKKFISVNLWVIGFTLVFVGFGLITLRSVLPFIVSVFIANALIPLGHIIISYGVFKFFFIPYRKRIDVIIYLAYLSLLLVFINNINIRIIAVSLISIYISIRVIFKYMKAKLVEKSKYDLYIYPPLVLLFFTSLVRFANTIINPMQNDNLLEQNTFNSFVNIMFSVLFVILALNIFLIINRKKYFETKEIEERFIKAFTGSSLAMLISEVDSSIIIDVNQAFIKLSGFSRIELIHKKVTDLGFWIDLNEREKMIQTIKENGSISNYQIPFYNKSKEKIETLISSSIIQSVVAPYLLTTITDITIIEKAKNELEYLANHDFLTQLHNRTHFYRYFDSKVKNNPNAFIIVLFDLNCFKNVNDRFGHDIGDQVLIRIANNIRSNASEDYLVARFGGDEFIFIKQGNEEDKERFITLIRNKLSKPFVVNGFKFQFDAAFGSSVYPYDSKKLNELIILADERLYIEKENSYTCERVGIKIK